MSDYVTGVFSIEENDYVLKNHDKVSVLEMAKHLNRKESSIRTKLCYSKLKSFKCGPKKRSYRGPYKNKGNSKKEFDIIDFANTLYPPDNQQVSILPVFKKYGRMNFQFMYKRYKKQQLASE
jgi:hypothetical protein